MKRKYIVAIALIACLLFAGCTDKNGTEIDNGSEDNGGTSITAPVDTNEKSEADAGDTTADDTEESGDTEADTNTEDTDADTSEPTDDDTDTTADTDTTVDTDADADTDTEKAEDTDEPTEDIVPPEDTVQIIDLGAELAAGSFATGQFVSHESDKLRLLVNYVCGMDETGEIMVDLDVWLESYDINCGPRKDTGKITIDGETHTYSTDSIVYEERTKNYVPFTVYTYQVPTGNTSCSIDVSWFFNGNYAGEEIDTLNARAVLIFSAE